ncbi:ImmA/IrrE family metallo-endopeptidase [Streptomyces actuosus]|uniref:Toxin n=2 Tax=Streptomyces TaxID=1883 RepID=A0A2U9PEC1_STRAS|nr:toxin [Streptomyces actuosus]MBM4823463.1 ImmA/IrrE family metallo-endopeptidase [Streptomyces actuosus]
MSTRAMKDLLTSLAKEAAKAIRRPAEPQVVMREFCRALSNRLDRPVDLAFRVFPADLPVPVSGMRIDFGERSVIVVEQNMHPEAQLVILGHELWHEAQGDSCYNFAGINAAARAAITDQAADAIRRAAERVLAVDEIPRDAILAVAARSDLVAAAEMDAETFGLLFGREARTWMTGRYAQDPVNPSTVEGRLNLSLLNRGGRIL